MPQVYILNKVFVGSWNEIEGNISHEIIDFVLTDSGRYFVYNVPYGTCDDKINVQGDVSYTRGTHEAEYLLLTSECHNNIFSILYRIKLTRKVHNVRYSRKWTKDARNNAIMQSVYEENEMYYGGRIISDLIDNTTPLVTFEAECIEAPAEPIEVSLKNYNYQHNIGYVYSDDLPKDYMAINESINGTDWIPVELGRLDLGRNINYSSKTFLDLILKNKSEECYTNMLYSLLNEPGMLHRFCNRFAPGRMDERDLFTVAREHKLIGGRMDVCADNGHQRIVIENKLESGLNGIRADSRTQLSMYFEWASDENKVDSPPICFITAPDYRIFPLHEMGRGQLEMEIVKYDHRMLDQYILVSYGDICGFLEENIEAISEEYEYYRYLDDIIAAFRRYSYRTKSAYYRSLLQARI